MKSYSMIKLSNTETAFIITEGRFEGLIFDFVNVKAEEDGSISADIDYIKYPDTMVGIMRNEIEVVDDFVRSILIDVLREAFKNEATESDFEESINQSRISGESINSN